MKGGCRAVLVAFLLVAGTSYAQSRRPAWRVTVHEPGLAKALRRREVALNDRETTLTTSGGIVCHVSAVDIKTTSDLGTLHSRLLQCSLPTKPKFVVEEGAGCFVKDGPLDTRDGRGCVHVQQSDDCDKQQNSCRGVFVCIECFDSAPISLPSTKAAPN